MEEPSRIVLAFCDRKPGEALTVILRRPCCPGSGSREPHLFDYLIILRKHQWLDPHFCRHRGDGCHHRFLQDEARVRERAARVEGDNEVAVHCSLSRTLTAPTANTRTPTTYIETQTKILQQRNSGG